MFLRARINQSASTRNEELQNKPRPASGDAESAQKKLLFAKQTAGGQWSHRAGAEKTTFLQNKPPASSSHTELTRKNYFLQNKLPPAAGKSDWHLTTTA